MKVSLMSLLLLQMCVTWCSFSLAWTGGGCPTFVVKGSAASMVTRQPRMGVQAKRGRGGVEITCVAIKRNDPDRQLAALSFPMKPDPSLSSEDVVRGLVGGLQHNDLPSQDTGLERFYNFATFTCKSALTARQGAKSLQNFTKYASREPVFSHLVRCESFELGESTLIKGTPTRGDLASHIITIKQSVGFRYRSGIERSGEGVNEIETIRYRVMMQKERLPPLDGCWMVHECLCLKHGMLFNGDAGGTTTD